MRKLITEDNKVELLSVSIVGLVMSPMMAIAGSDFYPQFVYHSFTTLIAAMIYVIVTMHLSDVLREFNPYHLVIVDGKEQYELFKVAPFIGICYVASLSIYTVMATLQSIFPELPYYFDYILPIISGIVTAIAICGIYKVSVMMPTEYHNPITKK